MRFALLIIVCVLLSGCATLQEVNVFSKNSAFNGNQVLASRSTAADNSHVGSKMEGGDNMVIDIPLMAPLKEGEDPQPVSSLKLNVFSENKTLSVNQVGVLRSIGAIESEVESDMKGGDTGKVSVVVVPTQ